MSAASRAVVVSVMLARYIKHIFCSALFQHLGEQIERRRIRKMGQMTPVPAHAKHLRNPRRSMPSSFVFASLKSDKLIGILFDGLGASAHPHQVPTDWVQQLFLCRKAN